jgi:hypothetical protein
MSRATRWIVATAVADAIMLGLTLHAQATFRTTPNGQSTSIGIVLGWIVTISLFLALAMMLVGARRSRQDRLAVLSRRPPPSDFGPSRPLHSEE